MDSQANKQNADSELKRNKQVKITLHSVVVFLFATLSTAILVDLLPIKCSYWTYHQHNLTSEADSTRTYAIYNKGQSEDHLNHVINILNRLGYARVQLEDSWNLLWAHDYPFMKMAQRMKFLKKFQMINHFPGCGFVTNKVDLSITPLPFLPQSFRLPSQRKAFLIYVQKHPNALYVVKHNEHRYITIQLPGEINLYSNDSFVQEFVQNPFLVDGYKFDIGVYVVVTSIEPLRLYIYSGDVLFRYCSVQYYPFNSSDVNKYVVGDNYLPTWKVPSLMKYYNSFGGSMRGAFDAYVRDQNLSPSKIWQQVEHIIRQTFLAKERNIAHILRSYNTKNFFELIRFDFIIDDTLKVYLMEANMSPNLSSAHFKHNSLLYEQLLYSVMNLVGIGSPVKNRFLHERSDITEIITSEKNLASNLNDCYKHACDKSCNRQECGLCIPCLSGREYEILEKAHYEHLHKISMKRIFPKPILQQPENFDIAREVQNMTKRNTWMIRWFYYKCVYDSTWCN